MNNNKYKKLTLCKLFIVTVFFVCVSGCNSIKKTMGMVIPFYDYNQTLLKDISVSSSVDSNNNMPVAIDIVLIFNEKIDPSLLGLSGPEWFANKAGLLLKNNKELSVITIEVVPRTMTESIKLPDNFGDALKVLMFANYVAPAGQFVADITQFTELKIQLNKSGYQLREMEQ